MSEKNQVLRFRSKSKTSNNKLEEDPFKNSVPFNAKFIEVTQYSL